MSPRQPAAPGAHHLQWPAAEFYWAIIDTASLPRRLGQISREQLGYLFEQSLPLPIDDVHAVYVRIGRSDRFIACGVERAQLQADLPIDALTLTPVNIPEWIGESAPSIPSDRFNLLTGQMEPPALRRSRRHALLELIVVILTLATVLVIGVERRIIAARSATASIESQRTELLNEVLSDSSTPGGLPPDVRMIAELRTLRQTRTDIEPAAELIDVSEHLARLLEIWPEDVHVRTQSLSATTDSITLRGILESVEASQVFVDAFRELASWRVQQPSVRTTRDGIDMELRLAASKESDS